MTFIEAIAKAAEGYKLSFNQEQYAAFDCYYRLLIEWNEKINLTAITQPEEVAVKHMIDSLTCLDQVYFPAGCSVIDVGTGAGFPGLPLKIVRPDINLTLLDSLNKRLTFLQEVVNQLHLKDVILTHSRAEDAGQSKGLRDKHDVAVSRAVARLNILCEYCLPLVKTGGFFVAMKGAKFQEEVSEAKLAVKILGGDIVDVREIRLPGLEDRRAVVYIKKVKATPSQYPRRSGLPEKKPL
ncbi:Ribosomal RNA small subunit methyltransferase G [bioreactor metagenome]|uniref:Ribosomal RNA small subunit methyltransferase G n=1 Tax=bioreactor metagenome TaxID=1076179 RepID=A0A644SY99_9ZZZZ|nr:16S rRNA (guanine(527)-N(7))-methyltransferase RsmG [Negativicutes bacterium]